MEANNFLYGVVEDIDDPLKLGKVRVRFFNIHSPLKLKTDNEGSATQDLNWCNTIMPVTGASMSGLGQTHSLLPGSYVIAISFDDMMEEIFILGTMKGIPTSKPNPNMGFADPNGIYPKVDYIKESDENRLARNENIDKTIIKTKIDNRELKIKRPNNKVSYDEPKTDYNAKYTKNKVTETESGHIIEMDDTPGHERIHTYHKSGTFEEIQNDGTKVMKIVGDDYQIIEKDGHSYVKGSFSITVIGDLNIKVDGNIEAEVSKDLNAVIHQNASINIEGDSDVVVKGNVSETIDGDYTQIVKGNVNVKAKTASYDIELLSKTSAGDIVDKSSGKIETTAFGDNIIKGKTVRLN